MSRIGCAAVPLVAASYSRASFEVAAVLPSAVTCAVSALALGSVVDDANDVVEVGM